MSDDTQATLRDPRTVPVPPFVTEETTARALYAALVRLCEWIALVEECFAPDSLAILRQNSPMSPLPEIELMGAISVWQAYRTLRVVRAVRIGFDYSKREYGDDGRVFPQQLYKLTLAARNAVNFAFTTPADFRAHHAARDTAVVQQFLRRQTGEES
jgi:hypothetical protein